MDPIYRFIAVEKKNIPFYGIMGVFFVLLKYWYTVTDANGLFFLLYPIAKIVGFLLNAQPIPVPGNGFFFEYLNIIIDKSCAGFNYWLLCFLMTGFLSVKYFEGYRLKTLMVFGALLMGYGFAIFVNSARILVLITIQSQSLSLSENPLVHESVGVMVNLTFLAILYLCIEKYFKTRIPHAKFS